MTMTVKTRCGANCFPKTCNIKHVAVSTNKVTLENIRHVAKTWYKRSAYTYQNKTSSIQFTINVCGIPKLYIICSKKRSCMGHNV